MLTNTAYKYKYHACAWVCEKEREREGGREGGRRVQRFLVILWSMKRVSESIDILSLPNQKYVTLFNWFTQSKSYTKSSRLFEISV